MSRTRTKLTQTALAALVGVNRHSLQNWERLMRATAGTPNCAVAQSISDRSISSTCRTLASPPISSKSWPSVACAWLLACCSAVRLDRGLPLRASRRLLGVHGGDGGLAQPLAHLHVVGIVAVGRDERLKLKVSQGVAELAGIVSFYYTRVYLNIAAK